VMCVGHVGWCGSWKYSPGGQQWYLLNINEEIINAKLMLRDGVVASDRHRCNTNYATAHDIYSPFPFPPLHYTTHNNLPPISLAEPWFHVGYFFLGGYIGNKWVNLEKELVVDINEIRADRGMPPMVGTNAWIKYKKPETESL
jgi:hypothetical protein